MEDLLWQRIFVREYIAFVFAPPPALDRVQNLRLARLVYPLQDSTIAKYKHVSPAGISYQRRRYNDLLRGLAEQIART